MTTITKRTAEYMGLEEYIRSEKQSRAGFTTTDGAGIIAEDLLQPAEQLSNRVDLTKYVTEIPVNRASGKYQFVKGTDSKLVSVAELVAKYGLSDETIRTKLISINQGSNGKHMYDPDAADALLKNSKVRRGPKRKN